MKVIAEAKDVTRGRGEEKAGFLRRVGVEVKTIWLLSSHGHTHGEGPGEHTHGIPK